MIRSLACIVLLWCLLLTHGTWQWFRPEVRGDVYDSLAAHLAQGRTDVNPNTIGWEGITLPDGRTIMYFGPFPALLRLPTLPWPSLSGLWSRLSCLLAACVALAGAMAAVLALPLTPDRRRTALLWTIWGLGAASPLVFLLACARIYHEAVLWGFAPACWGIAALAHLTWHPERTRWLAVLTGAAGIALLSRLTFGAPLCLASIWYLLRRKGAWSQLAYGIFLTAVCFQMWYNMDRFGNPLTVWDTTHHYLDTAKLGGNFHPDRIPSNLLNYWRPSPDYLDIAFPWVRQRQVEYQTPWLFQEWREWTLPLPFSAPWLLLAAPIGLLAFAGRRQWGALVLIGLLASQWLVILGYHFATQRYIVEFLPLLLFCWISALPILVRWRWSQFVQVAILCGMMANLGSTIEWATFSVANGDIPAAERRFFSRWLIAAPSPITGVPVYVSTLTPIRTVTPFDLYRPDQSYLGQPITIGGVPVTRGLGVHAPTTLTYALPPRASVLHAIVGRNEGSFCGPSAMRFRIRGDDGRVLWESGVHGIVGAVPELARSSPPETVNVPIAGEAFVSLEADPLGERDCDHATWADAAFVVTP